MRITGHALIIDLEESENRRLNAQRSHWNRNLFCLNCVLNRGEEGWRQVYVDYVKMGSVWVSDRDKKSLKSLDLKKSYGSGTKEYDAFEELSRVSWEEVVA